MFSLFSRSKSTPKSKTSEVELPSIRIKLAFDKLQEHFYQYYRGLNREERVQLNHTAVAEYKGILSENTEKTVEEKKRDINILFYVAYKVKMNRKSKPIIIEKKIRDIIASFSDSDLGFGGSKKRTRRSKKSKKTRKYRLR
jgi:hypothetical protein